MLELDRLAELRLLDGADRGSAGDRRVARRGSDEGDRRERDDQERS
jgi:hypothetical protein